MRTIVQRRVVGGTAAPRAKPVAAPVVPRARVVVVRAAFTPPTVAETKKKFLQNYNRPVAAIYNTVLQELLVQQHFIRYGKNYSYNEVFALGFVSVFEQILESLPDAERSGIFTAYIQALGEDPEAYRRDAARMESVAGGLSGPDALVPDANGNEVQAALAAIQSATSAGKFAYNRFVAIGLFRLLELTGAKEPAALERLVKAVGVRQESINKDLMMYKNVLSKLSAAKEMMREFLEREKRKQAEREASKGAKANAEAEGSPVQA